MEFNLSEKEKTSEEINAAVSDYEYDTNRYYLKKDVKEFIKRLKDNLNNSDFICSLHTMLYHNLLQHIEDEIDKLAGKSLV